MPIAKHPELFWLLMTTVLTALMFTPYVLRLIIRYSFIGVVADSTSSLVNEARWALLAKKAHYNAVENLVVFAPLVIMVQLLGASTSLTAQAAAVYFFARLVHFVVYTLAIPYVRTTSFLVAWACQLVLAVELFARL
jgi:uncharacterized MAPEG superfamily protein